MMEHKDLTNQPTSETRNSSNEKQPKTTLFFMLSEGHGGGIERYCDSIIKILMDEGVSVTTFPLLKKGQSSKLTLKLLYILRMLKLIFSLRTDKNVDVIISHPSLVIPVVTVCKVIRWNPAHTFAVAYGSDIWTMTAFSKFFTERYVSNLVTISQYSAGALSKLGNSVISKPCISNDWYDILTNVKFQSEDTGSIDIKLLTVFRLADARDKGLTQIIEAIEIVRKNYNCQLIVAGSGQLPKEFEARINELSWVTVHSNTDDESLGNLYADSDIFVLATRTRSSDPMSGEGFGMVLVEAQLTGTPVIAPAHGGSDDAFLNGITGLKPHDQSSKALANVLLVMITDAALRQRLGDNAKKWSQMMFSPRNQRAQILRVFMSSDSIDLDCQSTLEFK